MYAKGQDSCNLSYGCGIRRAVRKRDTLKEDFSLGLKKINMLEANLD